MNKLLLPISFLLLLNVCQTTEDRKRGCELCLFEKEKCTEEYMPERPFYE